MFRKARPSLVRVCSAVTSGTLTLRISGLFRARLSSIMRCTFPSPAPTYALDALRSI